MVAGQDFSKRLIKWRPSTLKALLPHEKLLVFMHGNSRFFIINANQSLGFKLYAFLRFFLKYYAW